jgi:hypothetical protein
MESLVLLDYHKYEINKVPIIDSHFCLCFQMCIWSASSQTLSTVTCSAKEGVRGRRPNGNSRGTRWALGCVDRSTLPCLIRDRGVLLKDQRNQRGVPRRTCTCGKYAIPLQEFESERSVGAGGLGSLKSTRDLSYGKLRWLCQ